MSYRQIVKPKGETIKQIKWKDEVAYVLTESDYKRTSGIEVSLDVNYNQSMEINTPVISIRTLDEEGKIMVDSYLEIPLSKWLKVFDTVKKYLEKSAKNRGI